MPIVEFHATSELRSWKHRSGGRRGEPLAGGRNARLVEPIWLENGESIEMDDSEAAWAVAHYPLNFKIRESE